MDYASMTIDVLLAEQLRLYGNMKNIKAQKRAVDGELQHRTITAEAVKKLAAMSPAERAVAAQLIGQAGGIATQEILGTPGV